MNLHGLPALLRAEIQWSLNAHAQHRQHSDWTVQRRQELGRPLLERRVLLADGPGGRGVRGADPQTVRLPVRRIVWEIVNGLRCVYNSPADTKDAGFLETDHFGRRFKNAQSHFDLTAVPQRWLRDLLWDHLTEWLRSPQCPRTRGPFDQCAAPRVELGVFLETDAPAGGHDPSRAAPGARGPVRRRPAPPGPARPALAGMVLVDGRSPTVTDLAASSSSTAPASCSKRYHRRPDRALGLDTGFLTAIPFGGAGLKQRSRNPFTDESPRPCPRRRTSSAWSR